MKLPLQLYFPKRRTSILAVLLCSVMGLIVIKLFIIQVLQHNTYKQKAFDEQVAKFVLPATRGQIYAKDRGQVVPLAMNQPVYLAFVDPQEIGGARNKSKILSAMREIAGGNVLDGFEERLDDSKTRYVVMAQKLSQTQAELIKKKNLPGVGLTGTQQRVYPEGALAAQVLGFVNSEGKGQYGVEEALDTQLKGVNGRLQTVTDVRRIPLTISKDDISQPAKNGRNLVLSIDRSSQAYVEQALKKGLMNVRASQGSVVVMNPNNGQVLAMANYPSYNPSEYGKVDDYSVLQNNVVSQPYEVGSVMKTLTMGAGLDSGAVTRNSTFNDATGCVQVDDRKICNVEEDPRTANATMIDVLHYSLNTGVDYILRQMGGGSFNRQGRDKLYEYFKNHYRFAETTGIEQAGEASGVMIAPDKAEGNNVRYANMAFGQGMDITMIQMAAAFSAAINGGIYYQPTIISGETTDGSQLKTQPSNIMRKDTLQPSTSTTLRNMIVEGRQLGVLGGKDPSGYAVGGKTGTSQIIDRQTGEYTDANSIGSYIGFGGTSGQLPQYVIMVMVKDSKAPGYAGTTAAGPIFQDISNFMIQHLQLQPGE
jgi:cell division protein FtsI/penicillin-binding protein 2